MLSDWRDILPRWPKSTRQSIESPLQLDRLPDTSRVELEYPSYRYSPAENRRHTYWIIFLAALLCLLPLPFEITFSVVRPIRPVASLIHALIATLGVYLFVIPFLGRKKYRLRWIVYFVLVPLLTAAFFSFAGPNLPLAVAMLFSLAAADLFATHFFHLKTTSPMPRQRALHLRKLWANRFGVLSPTAKGVELYIVALAAIPGVCLLLILSLQNVFPLSFVHLPPLFAGLLLLVVLPLVLEAAAAFLVSRRWIRPGVIFRAFRYAVVEWFTYNRHGAVAAGVFQSPAGSYRQRRRMSLGIILLFSVSTTQLVNYFRDIDRLIDSNPEQPIRGAPTQDLDDRQDRPGIHGFQRSTDEFGLAPKSTQPPVRFVSYQPEKPGKEPSPKLEPYQQRMLERMPPAEREEFLTRLKKDAAEAGNNEAPAPGGVEERTQLQTFIKTLNRAGWTLFFIFYHLLPVFLSIGFFLACCFTTSARVVGFYAQQFGTNRPDKLLHWTTWDELVCRIQNSGDKIEQNSLLLGVNAHDDYPVIVPRSVFDEHAHLLGDSGSGKTSLGLSTLISQFIRFKDCSVVVIDLKGDDMALFEGARLEAARADRQIKEENPDDPNARYRFRWFSNELRRPSYVFNPLRQRHFPSLSLYQRTDILTAAMGLQYGTDYGRGYFSDANAELLYHALKARPNVQSFKELSEVLRDKDNFRRMSQQLKLAAAHLGAIVNRLSAWEPLNGAPGGAYSQSVLENAIDMAELFEHPQVAYFHLSSALGTASSAEMARLALYCLLSASKTVGVSRTQVYVFIDEFQRIVANNLDLFLQTARSMNIGVILANQTLMDLKTADTDLISTVRANTRFKQVFAASDLMEQQEIMHSSGETIVYNRAWNEYLGILAGPIGMAHGLTSNETITPRLRPNQIILASDHPQQSVVYVRRGKGYAQFGGMPFVMYSTYHISQEEYEARRNAPWPDKPGETITPKPDTSGYDHDQGAKDPLLGKPPKSPAVTERQLEFNADSPDLEQPVAVPSQPHPLDSHWSEQQAKRKRTSARNPASDAPQPNKETNS